MFYPYIQAIEAGREECPLMAVLNVWLNKENTDHTWKQIINALDSDSVEEYKLAAEIECKQYPQQGTQVSVLIYTMNYVV